MSRIMKKVLQKDVNTIKEYLDGLKIEKLVGRKEKQQTLAIRFIIKNHT